MRLLNTSSQYGLVSRGLHWIIVGAIVAQWLLAEAGEDSGANNGADFDALGLHQSIGLTVLMVALVRFAWRFFNPKPAWPADMKSYEIRLARAVHAGFYLLLFAIPLTGWALSSAEPEPLRFFNGFNVPRIASSGKETFEEAHEILFNILVALAVLHVVGAAKHRLVNRAGRRSEAHG
jgi:cytochrome b561